MTLPAALKGLAKYEQFITHSEDKIPTSWRTGSATNINTKANWTDYDTAYACGYGRVGFVLTDDDPFWCIDIDNCIYESGVKSPLAVQVIAMLPNAAVEISMSGRGIHIWGSGHVPNHLCKGNGLEMYHTGRFIALGGKSGSTGDCTTDCTKGLQEVIEKYLAPPLEESESLWTTEPDARWVGPTDDDELIRRASLTNGAANVFGGKASFKELWEGDLSALIRSYPQAGIDRKYDASSADAALAQHLAYWTGRDCERILRLMKKSNLVREKWERKDYLSRTILFAIGNQKDVRRDSVVTIGSARDVVGETFMNSESQKVLFANCTYVADRNAILMPGGHFWKQEVFDAMLGGFTYALDMDSGKATKSAWEAFTRSHIVRFPKAHSATFRPDKKVAEMWQQGNRTYCNSYWPIETPTMVGDPQPFLDHVAKMLPDHNDQQVVINYMAAVIQYPGIKFQWCPLLQGCPGNGKTLLSRCLVEAIGKEHCHTPKADQLTGKFNDWLPDRIFIAVEDIYVANDRKEVLETLKPMITSDWLEIEGKGRDKGSVFICANFMLNSNHKDAIQKTKDDRRFAVLFTAQQQYMDLIRDGMDGNYFPKLYHWLKNGGYAVVTNFLRNYKIIDALNPATSCHRAPNTSSTAEAIRESMGPIEQEIMSAVAEDRVGFRGGWISSHFLDIMIQNYRANRIPRNKRRDILAEMGYIPHPGLETGQVHNPVQPDSCKPRLFCLINHKDLGLKGVAVAKAYEIAQIERSFQAELKLAS